MIDYWKASLPNLSTTSLIDLVRDAEARIGSHVAGGNPVNEYVEKQQVLLELIRDELLNRSKQSCQKEKPTDGNQ
jgi:hypothetical protein